jgi:hypothetical protein
MVNTTINDLVHIPQVYLSKSFIPGNIQISDFNKINKAALKLFTTLQKFGKSLFKLGK